MEATRIIIVDDQQLFREALVEIIQHTPGFELVFEADNGQCCLHKLAALDQLPHIALLDVEMPGMNGIELYGHIQAAYPGIRVLILSVHANERLVAQMVQAGVSGYLSKNCNRDELIAALQAIHKNGFYINSQTLRAIQRTSSYPKDVKNIAGVCIEITPREKEVLRLICQEMSNAEIADKLYISSRTVEGHRNHLLIKTGCRNTAGLVLFAVKHQIIEVYY